ALPSAGDAAGEFADLAERCDADGGGGQFCEDLRAVADRFAEDAPTIDDGIAAVRGNVVDTRDAIKALSAGAREVADGNAALAEQAVPLADGISEAAGGARDLADGASQTNKGARDLSDGADGVADGASQVDDGAGDLAGQLKEGLDEIPTYTKDERANLKTVAADPTGTTLSDIPVGRLSIPLFATLALWALALAVYVVTRSVPEGIRTSREPTWRIIVRAALPGSLAAAMAALAISAIAIPVLGLGPARALTFTAVALLASFAFVALNQAAVAIFGRAGRLASLAVLVLTGALGVVSTVPAPLYGLSGFLPTHGAVIALRAAAFGGSGLVTGAVGLAVWLVVGGLATVIITDRRRRLNPRQLRPAPAG
ncbi:MAG: YhgE/Pip domain-containing protein, partial [Stackebrandtia sp.]